MAQHRDFVRTCRAGYHQRRAEAQRGLVQNVASIIIDGALEYPFELKHMDTRTQKQWTLICIHYIILHSHTRAHTQE